MSKYEYRCFDSYDHWEDRFPDQFFVRKYHLENKPDGQPDVNTILRSVDQRVEETERLNRIYKDNPLSVTNFSRLSQTSIIESIAHLASHDDLPVRCCRGNDQEFAFVADAFRSLSTLVLDPSALATLFLTELFRKVSAFPQTIVVSDGSL